MSKNVYIGIDRPLSVLKNPGPFATTEGWVANQNATLSVNGSALRVVSNQWDSTPGARTTFDAIPAKTEITLIYTMRGNINVAASFREGTANAGLQSQYYTLTNNFQTFTLSGTISEIAMNGIGIEKVDNLFFFMDSSMIGALGTSAWFEVGQINLFYGKGESKARRVKNIFIGVSLNGHTQLEYIQSTGTQWINTGVKGNARWEFDIEFSAGTGQRQLMGYNSSGENYWGVQAHGGYGVHEDNTLLGVAAGGRDVVIHNYGENGSYYLSAQGKTVNVAAADVSSLEYQLFTIYKGASTNLITHAKLYGCKAYQNGVLVRNFIPAESGSGAVGLYDTVNGKFYANNGTGSFIAGQMRTLPPEYTQLEYIESNGTQYIDTGYSAPNGFIASVDFTFTSVSTSFGYIAGSHDLQSPYGRNGVGTNGASYWEIGLGDTYPSPAIQPIEGIRHTLLASTVKGDSYLEVDGIELITSADASTRSSQNLLVFTNQYQIAFGSGSTKGKLYSLKIYSPDNTLVRDFIPCKNPINQVGLYDLVTNKFYSNAGSGSFIAGSGIYQPSVARTVTMAYIGIGGVARPVFDLSGNAATSYGQIDSLGEARYGLGAASAESMAFFAGGQNNNGAYSSTLDVYNMNFGKVSLPNGINPARSEVVGASSVDLSGMLLQNPDPSDTTDFWAKNQDNVELSINNRALRVQCTNYTDSTPGVFTEFKSFIPINTEVTITYLMRGNTAVSPRFYNGRSIDSTKDQDKKYYDLTETFQTYTFTTTVTSDTNVLRFLMQKANSTHWFEVKMVKLYRNRNVLFAGGKAADGVSNVVEGYNISGTKLSVSQPLSTAARGIKSANVGSYSVFAGGLSKWETGLENCDAYNYALTKVSSSNVPQLAQQKYDHAATSVRHYDSEGGIIEYALFAGGRTTLPNVTYATNVDSYDSSLTHKTHNQLSQSRFCLAAASTRKHALFAGGRRPNEAVSTVDAYDSSLTRINVTGLIYPRCEMAAASVNGVALFCGGIDTEYYPTGIIDVYDESLTRTNPAASSTPFYKNAATNVKNYAIFAGGIYDINESATDFACAYQVY